MRTKPKTRPAVGSGFFLYLAAATACQGLFALGYWLLLARLSTFAWNRSYLLGFLLLSIALPLVALPTAWAQLLWPAAPDAAALPVWHLGAAALVPAATTAAPAGIPWLSVALAGYWLGVAWQVGRTARHLGWLYRLNRRHPRTRLGRGWLVQLPAPGRPAFSFGRCVFLSPAHAQLPAAKYALLVQHEQVHGAQYHSLDLLLAEVLGWFFWFNGLVPYFRRQLRLVHEYLADAAVTRPPGSRPAYGRLLLKLAAGPLPTALVHPFAARQVEQRIHMLIIPPSSPMKKLRFLLVVPVAALAWVAAATLGPVQASAQPATAIVHIAPTLGRIGKISWQGNRFLSAAQLDQALGLKSGDPYDTGSLEAFLANRENPSDITSRYMNNGYLFFSIKPVLTKQPGGLTDFTFIISEGPTVKINNLTVKGNKKVPTADILKRLPLRKGDLFSRAKLIQSQRQLAESSFFDPTQIGINPQPDVANGLVNLEYVLIEK